MAFGGTYNPPSQELISSEYLPKIYDTTMASVNREIDFKRLFVSIDGFSDVNSRPVFHLLAGSPLPFHFSSFRLGCNRESAQNVDNVVSNSFRSLFSSQNNSTPLAYGFVTDSPNVMTKARAFASEKEEGGSKFCIFSYGCVCHALSLVIKDIIKLNRFKDVFKNSTYLIFYFKKTHVAGSLLEAECEKLEKNRKV